MVLIFFIYVGNWFVFCSVFVDLEFGMMDLFWFVLFGKVFWFDNFVFGKFGKCLCYVNKLFN